MKTLSKLRNTFNNQINKLDLVVYVLILFQILFALNFLAGLVYQFYLQVPINELVSYKAYDLPGYQIFIPDLKPFGVHFFGDFSLTYNWTYLSNPWQSPVNVNYPPLAIEFVRLFRPFNYTLALFLYILLLFVFLVIPFAFLAIRFRQSKFVLLFLSVGLLNQPLLSTLDRGNVIGFLPVLLFFAGIFFVNSNYSISTFLIVLASSIKVYPALLLILLIAVKRWKLFWLGITGCLLVIFGPLMLYPGDKVLTIKNFVANFFGFTTVSFEQTTCRNSSFMGGLIRLLNDANLSHLSKFIYHNSFGITLGLLVVTIILILSKFTPTWLKLVVSFSTFSTLPLISFPYVHNWAIAALALVIYVWKSSQNVVSKETQIKLDFDSTKLKWVTSTVLIILMVPWTFVDNGYIPDCGSGYFPKINALVTALSLILLSLREIQFRINHRK